MVRCPVGTPGRPGPGTGTVPGGVSGLFFLSSFLEKSGDTDFVLFQRVSRMESDYDDERERASGDGDGDGDGDGHIHEVIHIVDKSAAGGSAGSILQLPERTDDDSAWLSHDGIKPATGFNKMKPDNITTVLKRKMKLAQEVASTVMDRWLRDQVTSFQTRNTALVSHWILNEIMKKPALKQKQIGKHRREPSVP